MRVLLVNRFYGNSQTPTGRMLEDVALELVEQGHEVEVLTSGGSYVRAEETSAQPQSPLPHRIRVRRVWTPSRGRMAPWVGFLLQALVRAPLLRWDRIVLLTDPPMLPVLGLVTLRTNRSVYWWTMDLYPEAVAADGLLQARGIAYRCLKALNGLALKRADGVVTLGARQTQRLRQYDGWLQRPGSRHAEVAPWDFRVLPRVERADNTFLAERKWQDRKIALYAGNLGEAHSYEELTCAARTLASQGRTDWLFVFVVRGSRKAALEREAATMENVIVLDYLPANQTNELLWSADVHLITMRVGWEGIVVPSKLYGVLMTDAPVLFIGPSDSDTALEIRRYGRGTALPPGVAPTTIVETLERLSTEKRSPTRPERDGPARVARFLALVATAPSPHGRVIVERQPQSESP